MKILSTFKKFRPRLSNLVSASEVQWLSHHIPKTAGTSLKACYDEALGRRQIYNLYNPVLVKQFASGNSLDLPKGTRLIHGHYQPHPKQLEYFPSAQRIVWVRDPVARAWSVLKHLVRVQQHKKEFVLLKEKFGERIHKPDHEILDYFLKRSEFRHMNRPYQNYFDKVSIDDFAFVGVTENFSKDIKTLSNLMNVELANKKLNVIASNSVIDKDDFKHYLKDEYKVIRNFISYD
tara:strand:- start:1081 stop:1782 length:702 start_codon:yes stop_codon:yes gene_type:complete